jgi:hypothetical protein
VHDQAHRAAPDANSGAGGISGLTFLELTEVDGDGGIDMAASIRVDDCEE